MQVYLVGGAVRDELIGREVVDRDYVVVGATPEELLNQGFEQVGKDFPVFLHPHTKDEYALARTERKAGAGYTGFTCYAAADVTLEDDLKRRDLTINAIAKSKDGELIDPFGGIEDIQKRQLRHVSEAFTEDPLRVLRLARFAARFADLGFAVAPSTWQLAQQMIAQNTLAELTQERVWHEISMALTGPNPEVFCQLLSRLKAWPQLVGPIARQAQQWDDLKTLSSTNKTSLATAYAVFAWHLVGSHADNVKQLHRTLRVPNVCGDVANLTLRIMAGLSEKTLTPAYLMTLFKAADPLRRPERWQQALAAVKVISAKTKGIEYLEKTKQAYCDVDVQALVNSNLGGAELGRAIQARRQQAITTVLER